jgi:Ferric reductase like transmembrane component
MHLNRQRQRGRAPLSVQSCINRWKMLLYIIYFRSPGRLRASNWLRVVNNFFDIRSLNFNSSAIMSMHMGAGNDPSIAHLSLSDPRCNNDSCVAFQAAHNASQAQVSYIWQDEYGRWTTWYYLTLIFLFMLPYFHHLWNDRRSRPSVSQRPSIADRAVAVWRMISYRRYSGHIADALGMPSMGLQIFLLGAILFATVATFAVRPYYRCDRGYGSPPLAVRTGLMAVALMPIIVALSGKVNIVTILTGIGYEMLNVIHRLLSYICFALSVVHTVPFILAPLKDGGPRALHKQYYKTGVSRYYLRPLNERDPRRPSE